MMQGNNEKIENLMKNAIAKIKDIIDVNTVIGSPINCFDGTMIIPITKVTVGFIAGGGEYTQNIPPKNAQKEYPFAGGSTAGFSVSPIGFLVGNSDKLKLITVESKNTFDDVMKLFKDLTQNMKK